MSRIFITVFKANLINGSLITGNITNTSALVSSAEFLANAANGNINLSGNNQLSGPVSLLAAQGDVTFENSLDTVLGKVTANNFILNVANGSNTTQVVGEIITADAIQLDSAGDFDLGNNNALSDITVVNSNNVTIKNINKSNIIDIKAAGNVDVTSKGISLGSVAASTIKLDAGSDAITDTNGAAVNLKANNVVLLATNGIGSTDDIETEITGTTAPGEITAINKNGGNIALSNVGDLLLRNISNLDNDGNISIVNDGDLTIDTIETITDFNDLGKGRIGFTVFNGNVTGSTKDNYLNQSDVRANSALFLLDNFHSIGTGDRPLSVEVPDTVQVFGSSQTFIFFYGTEPLTFEGENEFSNQIFDLINNLAGQQLIEVESLAQERHGAKGIEEQEIKYKLQKINKEINSLKRKLTSLEKQKVELIEFQKPAKV